MKKRCFKNSFKLQIIGATTTGAAKNRKTLEQIGCRVLIVEEAAEVLEAHIVSAMLPTIEHAILIGDHQQLRPNPGKTFLEFLRNIFTFC